MHESVPQPRLVHSPVYDEEDEDYDVYLYFPSRNRLFYRPRLSSQWDDDTASELSGVLSPTYSCDSDFVFPETPNDGGISTMGYSKIFRTGFWAQSCRISKRLDAFIAKAAEKLRFLKSRLARKMSRRRED